MKNEGSLLESVKEMFIFSVKNETLKTKLEMGRKGFERFSSYKDPYSYFAVGQRSSVPKISSSPLGTVFLEKTSCHAPPCPVQEKLQ